MSRSLFDELAAALLLAASFLPFVLALSAAADLYDASSNATIQGCETDYECEVLGGAQ